MDLSEAFDALNLTTNQVNDWLDADSYDGRQALEQIRWFRGYFLQRIYIWKVQ